MESNEQVLKREVVEALNREAEAKFKADVREKIMALVGIQKQIANLLIQQANCQKALREITYEQPIDMSILGRA